MKYYYNQKVKKQLHYLAKIVVIVIIAGFFSQQVAGQNSENGVIAENFQEVENANLEKIKVTVNFSNISLDEAILKLGEKAGLTFNYNGELLHGDRKISYSVEEVTVADALQFILPEGIEYITVRDIVILKVSNSDLAEEAIQETVSGQVIDAETGDSLIGVTVLIKDTEMGAATDAEGNFELTVPSLNETLVFSYIGYQTQEVEIDGRNEIEVQMTPSSIMGDELIVVGYGSRKRDHLTGAVDHRSGEDISNRVLTNLTQGLQGIMPNVNIDPMDGRPGESPEINIRGATSIGMGGSALVLIDGVEGDPSMLNPSDVESISVLKDASSAAMYGARGAFGVVLITTTQQDEPGTTLTYETRTGLKRPTVPMDIVTDSYTWATMFNESFINWHGSNPSSVNKTLPFSQEYLEELERRSKDPNLPRVEVGPNGEYWYFNNTDWYDELYTDNIWTNEHNLTLSASTESTRLLISGRFLNQDGLFQYNPDDYRMLNLRVSGTVDLYNWLQFNNNFSVSRRDYFNPINVGEGQGIWRNIADEGHPMAPMFNPDGTLTHVAAYTVGDHWYGKNGSDYERTVVRNKAEVVANIFDNQLSIHGDFSFQNTYSDEERRRVQIPYSRTPGEINYIGTQYNDFRATNDQTKFLASNLYGQFENTFYDRHLVGATVGVNYEQSTFERLRAGRNGLIFEDARDLNLTTGEDISTTGGYEKWMILGGFARVNYIYNERYLIEFSGRYDGSSKFPANERYAFFPAVSAGWRVTRESFWNVPEHIVSDFRIRASYGSMGNGNIGSYVFNETFNISTSGRINGDTQPRQTSHPGAMPDGLTWETSTTRNLGLDLEFISGRLQFTGDAYVRETTDMYTRGLSLPRIFGTASPFGNYADLETKGWEASLTWRDDLEMANRPMSYKISLSMSDNKAVITRFNNPEKFLSDYYEGMVVGEIWGYVTEGFFESEEDVINHADQSYFRSRNAGGHGTGDIKFKDLNGDGVIGPGEGTLYDPGDRKVIGNESPRYRFGINISMDYSNFFMSAFFQGVGKQDWYPGREASYFWGQYNRPYSDIPAWHMEEGMIWSEENLDSYFPKYTSRLAHEPNTTLWTPQTRYLQKAAYIRLKNFQFGYHLPQSVLGTFGMETATVYFTGENLWTWSPMYRRVTNIDVENSVKPSNQIQNPGGNRGDGYNYPMMRSVTIGLSVTF